MILKMSGCIAIRIHLGIETAEKQKTKAEQNQKKFTDLMEECKLVLHALNLHVVFNF